MDASIFIPCSDCSYLFLLELPQTLPCLFSSKVSLFEAGEGPAQSRAHFEGCSRLGLVGFEHLQGWRCKPCSGPCPRAAPLSQGKISVNPLGISHVGPCALEKHPPPSLHSTPGALTHPCRVPSCSLLLSCLPLAFPPCLWLYPRHLGVWVTPEEEAARELFTAGEMPLLRARKKVRRARQTVPTASPWQQGLPDTHTGKGGQEHHSPSTPTPNLHSQGSHGLSPQNTFQKNHKWPEECSLLPLGKVHCPEAQGRQSLSQSVVGFVQRNVSRFSVSLHAVKPNSTSLSSRKPRTSNLIRSRSQIRF